MQIKKRIQNNRDVNRELGVRRSKQGENYLHEELEGREEKRTKGWTGKQGGIVSVAGWVVLKRSRCEACRAGNIIGDRQYRCLTLMALSCFFGCLRKV